MEKTRYLNLKRFIKNCSLRTVLDLSSATGLSVQEENLLIYLNKGCTKTKACLDSNISERKYTNDLHRALGKVDDYLKRAKQ
jgi:hydroxyacyl-ACP dehydratase HTD2-like protein with hotdog domain